MCCKLELYRLLEIPVVFETRGVDIIEYQWFVTYSFTEFEYKNVKGRRSSRRRCTGLYITLGGLSSYGDNLI